MDFQQIKIRHRLLTKLSFSHILVAAIPIVFAAWFAINTTQHSIQQSILARNLELAKQTARLISTKIYQAHAIIHLTAQNPAIYEGNRIIQDLTLNNLINQFPIFNRISIIDKQGQEIVSTSFSPEKSRLIQGAELIQAFQDESYHSNVYMSIDNLPVMDIAESIRRHNEVIGLLFVQVNLRVMWEIVEGSAIGKSRQAFIFNNEGNYIAHSDRKQVYLNRSFREQDIIHDVQHGKRNEKIYRNADQQEMLTVYTPIFSNLSISQVENNVPDLSNPFDSVFVKSHHIFEASTSSPMGGATPGEMFADLKWGLVIQQSTRHAFATAKRMRRQIIAIGVTGVILAAFLALIITRWIVAPIRKLRSGIERFSGGELNYEIEPLGHDEIGALSKRFNSMAKRLLEFQAKLKRSERFEILNRMSSVLSHEIRNPLNSMVINMQIMRRELSKPTVKLERFEKYLDIIHTEIKRLDQLVHNFLLVSRPLKLNKQKVAIDDILNDIILTHQIVALGQGIRVERRFEYKSLYADIDAVKMKQVFLNLYLNAIQSMFSGGKLLITLSLLNQKDWLDSDSPLARIQFIDTGRGIRPEDLKHIFDFYFSTKEQGTGLGLSIAQQIVEEHGGKIAVKSTMRQGTMFVVFLPLGIKKVNHTKRNEIIV